MAKVFTGIVNLEGGKKAYGTVVALSDEENEIEFAERVVVPQHNSHHGTNLNVAYGLVASGTTDTTNTRALPAAVVKEIGTDGEIVCFDTVTDRKTVISILGTINRGKGKYGG
ncbi:hypothetical protein HYV64_00965 [Candidatus Shapirobacteria bacterium]|nr:hypothetical protein [Candidatus Shapirobacteria bacterium]